MADEYLNKSGLTRAWNKIKSYFTPLLDAKVSNTDYATDDTYGIVKTDSTKNISLDADGKLVVGGRFRAV